MPLAQLKLKLSQVGKVKDIFGNPLMNAKIASACG